MKAPWPKLSTSIRPNTRVSPDAMMKIIMPMARPATVSVTQVEGEPISGSASSISAGTSAIGHQSTGWAGICSLAVSVVLIGADPG